MRVMDRAEAIRALRQTRLQTQVEFARDLGVTRQTVIELEKGSKPSLRTARRLVEIGLDRAYVSPDAMSATSRKESA